MVRLILASQSPARTKLLAEAGIRHSILVSDVDEDAVQARYGVTDPHDTALLLARAKAEAVAALPEAEGALVLGCDSVFEFDGEAHGKPYTAAVARERMLRMSGNAGVLLSRVVRVKPGAAHPWLIVDAAMNDLMRPALYDAYHHIDAVVPGGGRMTANVVGPVCESGDTFAMAREMDAAGDGDLIVFRTAGAYGAAMSSGYNSRPLTAEVMIDGDRWALVRRRIDLAEVAAMPLPHWLDP